MRPTLYWITHDSPGRLAIVARPRGNDWLKDELDELSQTGINVLVSLLTSEENIELGLEAEQDMSQKCGLTFIGFAINDYDVPSSLSDFALLVQQIDEHLSRGKTVAVHCRQSIGRSSVLVACLLAISNENVDECFEVIGRCRRTVVPDTTEQKAWVRNFARECNLQSLNR